MTNPSEVVAYRGHDGASFTYGDCTVRVESGSTAPAETLAKQIAAFLRFQSAMTPEMWQALLDACQECPDWDVCQRARAALDTLRQEIQQP